MSLVMEAIIVRAKPGDFREMEEVIDPVLSVTIDNGLNDYRYEPDEIISITLRPRKEPHP